VYLLTDNNTEAVGFITAVMGMSQLITSFPSGILADKYRRDTMLKIASGIGLLAIIATLFTLILCMRSRDGHVHFSYLVVPLAIWGCFRGVSNTSLSALFADSIPTGQRSKYFTQRTILITLGNTTGPLVALTMFFFLGDHWTVKDCATVMLAGQLISAPTMVILCMMSDDNAVNVTRREDQTAIRRSAGQSEGQIAEAEEGTANEPCPNESEDNDDVDNVSDIQNDEPSYFGIPSSRVIPVFIASADLLSGLGAGMSIRYFPIFFMRHLKLSPVGVQVLYLVSPVVRAVLLLVAQKISKQFGRMHVAAGLKWTGIMLTICMIGVYLTGMSRWLVCILYISRSAFINSTSALTRSMLMDNVPKEERGKWAALESVNMFSWSGTAALGGIFVAKLGIIPLFGFTAIVQFVATLPIAALFKYDNM
jgi:MFS family permease